MLKILFSPAEGKKSGGDEVKKELRGKYKRHYWPDDPLVAQATARVKKKM